MSILRTVDSGNGGRVFQPVQHSTSGGQAYAPVQSNSGSAALWVRALIQWRVRKPALRYARNPSSRE